MSIDNIEKNIKWIVDTDYERPFKALCEFTENERKDIAETLTLNFLKIYKVIKNLNQAIFYQIKNRE